MKRKMNTIIALILAITMVFPMAVFVGAVEEPTENPTMEMTIKDSINTNGHLVADVTISATTAAPITGSITLAETGNATGTIKLPDGYTLQTTGEIQKSAAVMKIDGAKKTFTITADKASNYKTATFEITATQDGESPITITLTVKVVSKAIIDVKLYGTSDAFDDEQLLTDRGYIYDASDDLTVTRAEVLYNTKKDNYDSVPLDDSNITLEVVAQNDQTSECEGTSVDLKGGDKQLKYTYTDTEGYSYNGTVSLKVNKDIESIEIFPVEKDAITDEAQITRDAFLERIAAHIEISGYNMTQEYFGNEIVSNPDFTLKFYEDTEYQTEVREPEFNKDAYFRVEYKDVKYDSFGTPKPQVKDYFDFRVYTPKNITIDWTNAETTEYYEYYTIGTDPDDWDGVVVTVFYEYEKTNGGTATQSKTYDTVKEITDLNLKLSPVQVNQKYTYVSSIEGVDVTPIRCNFPEGFTLLHREVTGISLTPSLQSYTAGDHLNLSNVNARITFNYGDPVTLPVTDSCFTRSPENGTELTTSNRSVLIVYTDPNTEIKKDVSLSLSVKAAPVEKPADPTITNIIIKKYGETEYYVGQAFEDDDYELLFIYSDGSTKERSLSTLSWSIDSNAYASGRFTKELKGYVKLVLNDYTTSNGSKVTFYIENINVEDRPILESITLVYKGTRYGEDEDGTDLPAFLEGETPTLNYFQVVAKYDNRTQTVIEMPADDTEYESRTGSYTKDGITHTLTLTPTALDSGDTEVKITYKEYISELSRTTTKSAALKIVVEIPDCVLSYYDSGWQKKPFMNFADGLEAAEDYADSLTSSISARRPTLQLRKDVTMISDYSATEIMEIDLNGHDLTMIRGELFVKSNSAAEITFSNGGNEDSKLIYSSDDEDNIIIAEEETYVINSDSGDGKYTVTITKPANGTVTGPDEVTHGHDAKFTLTPAEDYQINKITVKEGNSNKTYTQNDNVITVTNIQDKLTITVTFQEKAWENPFTDVYKSANYYSAIQFVYENGLFEGTSRTKFEPNTTMDRAMFVTVLGRLAGVNVNHYTSTSFTDVPTGQWYSEYVEWAASIGIVQGYGDGRFGPEDPITHAEMYVMMARYADIVENKNTVASSTTIVANDIRDIPDWAYEAVQYAAKGDFLVASNYRLTPNAEAKRSTLAQLLEKFCTNVLNMD